MTALARRPNRRAAQAGPGATEPKAVSGLMAREGGGSDSAPPPIVQLVLPAPPSANNLFKNVPGKGRVRTTLYGDWLSHAGWRLRTQHPGLVEGPVLILIGIERTNSMADIDNRLKATLDLLVAHKVIEDDRFVAGVAAAWLPARDGLMRLAITPARNLAVRFQLAIEGAGGGWFVEAPSMEEGAI